MQQKYEKAFIPLEKAIELHCKINKTLLDSKSKLGQMLNTLLLNRFINDSDKIAKEAKLNYEEGKYNVALFKYMLAGDLSKKKSDKIICFSAIASCYRELKAWELAKEFCNKALDICKKCNNFQGKTEIINAITTKLNKIEEELQKQPTNFVLN